MNTALFDPVQAGREITHTYVEYVAAGQAVADRTQQRDAIKAKLIDQLRAAHGHVADFKAFLKEHVNIPRSTAYRMLAIADGRGEEVRRQERDSKRRARVQENPVLDTNEAAKGAAPRRRETTPERIAEARNEEKYRLLHRAREAANVTDSFFDDDKRTTLTVCADADTIEVVKSARDAWDRLYHGLCADLKKKEA
jgi:hypothetical protein